MESKHFDKVKYLQIREGFDEVRSEYMGLEPGYNNRQHLQQIRADMTNSFWECVDLVRGSKFERVLTEHYRHSVLGDITLEYTEDRNGKKGMSVAEAERHARSSDEYVKFLEEMASAHADWEVVRHLTEGIKLFIYTVASHIDSIREPFANPKDV